MRKLLLSAMTMLPWNNLAANSPCPQIDMAKKFADGIPYCPESVKDNAFTVTRCAFNQAKEWHSSKPIERKNMQDLIVGLKSADAKMVLAKTNALNLQVCRSQDDGDSFLLMYTKPKVKNYSGPFIMFREGGKDSGVVLHSPHDGQDGTHRSTKAAFQASNALALISNGHNRTLSGRRGKTGPFPSDWAHTSSDLGYQAFLTFKNVYAESIHLHIHGLAANKVMATDSVGWNAPHTLRDAFVAASKKALEKRKNFIVEEWRFNGWITGIAMTMKEGGKGRDANQRWVGAEVAVRLHQNTNFVAQMVQNLEADYLKKPRPSKRDVGSDVPTDPNDVATEVENGNETDDPEMVEQPPIEEPQEEPVVEPEPIISPVKQKLPPQKPLKGVRTLACIAVNYTDKLNDYMTVATCKKAADGVAKFYEEQSRGLLKFKVVSHQMKYGGKAWDSWEKAEQVAKREFKADYYIIPNLFRKGGNHAGGKIAHVIQLTGWVLSHEVGHLLGLGHTGMYVYDKDGKPKLEPYNDKDSLMGNSGTKALTAPQYYLKDWTPDSEFVVLDPKVKQYELKKITNFKGKGLSTIIVPPSMMGDGKGRAAFISFPPVSCKKGPCAALRLSSGGGSQRVAIVNDEFYDEAFTGLHIKKLGAVNGNVTVSVDFDPKPVAFKQDPQEIVIEKSSLILEGDVDHDGVNGEE